MLLLHASTLTKRVFKEGNVTKLLQQGPAKIRLSADLCKTDIISAIRK